MVIEDLQISRPPQKLPEASLDQLKFELADPIDRLAATVIDLFIVLMPAMLFLSAPFKRIIFESLLLDNDLNFAYSAVLSVLVLIVSVAAYQSITVWFFGATFGKLFLGLKVINIWDQSKPKFLTSLLRSFFWVTGVFSLGVAFISILSNQRRRSFHDRVSETIVVSELKKGVHAPTFIETSIVKGIFAGFLTVVMLIMFFSMFQAYQNLSGQEHLAEILEQQGGLCSAVGESYREWPEEDFAETPRLSVAMALYAAGTINASCLESEVNFLFRQDRTSELTYLAKAFIHADRVKLSNAYLRKTCADEKPSPHCIMSRVVELWDGEDWESVDTLFKSMENKMPLYVRLWSIRSLIKKGDFDNALEQINKVPTLYSLRDFKIKFKAMAYWGTRSLVDANKVADIAFDSLDDDNRVNLSAWICFNEVSSDCKNLTSKSCQILDGYYGDNSEDFANDMVALTYLRKNSCANKPHLNIGLATASHEIKKLISALEALPKRPSQGREQLWDMANNSNIDEKIRGEAARYLIGSVENERDLIPLLVSWKVHSENFEWQKTGLQLFHKLYSIKSYSRAVEVGEKLKSFYEADKGFMKEIVVSTYKSGDHARAWELLGISNNSASNSRFPASQSDFDNISRQLKQEFTTR